MSAISGNIDMLSAIGKVIGTFIGLQFLAFVIVAMIILPLLYLVFDGTMDEFNYA